LLPLLIAASVSPVAVHADDAPTPLATIVVTVPAMSEPLTVVTDPKAPQQPVPANDGASYLKNIPGFTMIRKGGTDGDPVLRGLAGSRLNVLLDGMDFHGGCGMRMDPPTAYVFPETFDKVTVIKGPQTVAYGNGNSAGVVLFERDRGAMQPEKSFLGSLMAGSWERFDALATGRIVTDKAHFEATATHAESGNYEDGDGNEVHSAYQRDSANILLGYRPDANTRVDLDFTTSKAEAAYADRAMDGVRFDRDSYGLTLEKTHISPLVAAVSARVYHTYIDHVMDNYSLRTKTAMNYMVNNPDRETDGARVSTDLNLGDMTVLKLGADWRDDTHTLRTASNPSQAVADAYASLARVRDYESTTAGAFGELTHHLSQDRRVIGGLRYDNWDATRYSYPSGAVLASAERDLSAGFVRYEQDLAGKPLTAYIGVGHNERPMDYWEAVNKIGLSAISNLNPEQTTQLDTGVLWKSSAVNGSLSAFYAKVNDYILTRTNGTAGCANANGCAENVDATRYGLEADLAWKLASAFTLRGSVAYVFAENDTMDQPLAQTPPLEGRLGLDYVTGDWTLGSVLRMVARQDRVHVGYGNIVGQDYGETAGFATLALNASYKPGKRSLVTVGVDNVLDKTYSEHLARDNTFAAGPSTRVNEPGRFFWGKINVSFD
jgi:iron complex outermembrane receptor protein